MHRRDFIASIVALSASVAWGKDAVGPDSSFDPTLWMDDLAILNGRIITLDARNPLAEAVLVKRGRIAAVGSNHEIRSQAGGIRILDVAGRGVVPGFVDTHQHLEWSSIAMVLMGNLYTPPPKSIADVLSRLKAQADHTPSGRWVIAHGPNFLGKDLAEGRLPTIQELDSVSQQHPIVVFAGVHTSVANTLAAKAMGYLTYEDQAAARFWSNGMPFTGGIVARDSAGLPGPANDLVMRLPRNLYTVDELKEAARRVVRDLFVAGGVTTGSPLNLVSSDQYSADQELQARGELPMRIRAYYMAPFSVSVEGVLDTGLTRGFGNDMFRVGGFKLIMDGGREGTRQVHHYTQDEFVNLLTTIEARGFQTITHCVSQEGAALVVEAVAEVRRRFPGRPAIRHRVEHQRPLSRELALRMKEAQVGFSMIASQARPQGMWQQYSHFYSGGPFVDGSPSLDFGATNRTYIAEGLHPILISDKCSGGPIMPRPIYSIAAACNPDTEGGAVPKGETIEFDDALRMWTLWAAESTHQELDRGSISVGKLGDFAVLSTDPHHLKPQELFTLQVQQTILGGKIVYGA